jgi:exodeoxyribonuclease VIII
MDVMLDLETFDTKPSALVLAIGAVRFDKNGVHASFYRVLSSGDQQAHGRTMSASTALWWMQQEDAARREVANPRDIQSVEGALRDFAEFVLDVDVDGVWGNGSDFDNAILGSLYDAYGLHKPWAYHQNRCYRTLKALYQRRRGRLGAVRDGTPHHALDDAMGQARQAVVILNDLDLWSTL